MKTKSAVALLCVGAACSDAGAHLADAGVEPPMMIDAGGPLALAVPCEDDLDAVYDAAPASVASPADRGAVVRCARDRSHDRDAVQARLDAAGVAGVVATTGVSIVRIAYRTERGAGRPGIGSALVILPDVPRPGPLPVVVFAHGTAGLADRCAPSRFEGVHDFTSLPWAARGHIIIAPDYAGLGTAGIQGYGDNRDTGQSVLDAARALRQLLDPGRVSTRVVLAGHSQGGGAVLAAQALARDYGSGGELAAVVNIAGGYQFAVDAPLAYLPNVPTATIPGPAAILAATLSAFSSNQYGEPSAGALFPMWSRDALVAALSEQCAHELVATVPAIAPRVRDIIRDAFRLGVVSCLEGGPCAGMAADYHAFLRDNVLPPDPTAGAVLVLQGLDDTLASPERTACVRDRLTDAGVRVTTCTFDGADHHDVVPRGAQQAIAWAEATLAGEPPPACADALPPCPP